MKKVKIRHPERGYVIDAEVPEEMTLTELMDELVESGFINRRPDECEFVVSKIVDMNKTLEENGWTDDSIICLTNFFPGVKDMENKTSAESKESIFDDVMRVQIPHPITGFEVDVEVPNDMTIQELIVELIESGFISGDPAGYWAVWNEKDLDSNKTLKDNDVKEDSTIRIMCGVVGGNFIENE